MMPSVAPEGIDKQTRDTPTPVSTAGLETVCDRKTYAQVSFVSREGVTFLDHSTSANTVSCR